MKTRASNRPPEKKSLKNPLRRANCQNQLSRKLKLNRDQAIPADRGACEPETESQGSE